MGALISILLRTLVSAGIFAAIEAALEKIIDRDDETAIDELGAVGVTGLVVSVGNWKQLLRFTKAVPLPKNVSTPAQVADYLEQIAANQKGFAALNARFGGFAPLVVKLTKAAAAIMTKRGAFLTLGGVLVTNFLVWLLWLPGLIQQFWDQGVFAPEQANSIMEAWGLPFRWDISEVRKTQTELEAIRLEEKLTGAIAGAFAQVPKTRITMAKTTKPTLFLGTLFSQRVKATAAFERGTSDQIDSKEELQSDAQTELNRWLATLPSRLIYTINTALNPFDENGIKQSGTWATMTLLIRSIGGKTTPIDTILLGPVDPIVYYPKSQEVQTIQRELPKLLTAEEIAKVELPSGDLSQVDKSGNIVPITLAPSRPAPSADFPVATSQFAAPIGPEPAARAPVAAPAPSVPVAAAGAAAPPRFAGFEEQQRAAAAAIPAAPATPATGRAIFKTVQGSVRVKGTGALGLRVRSSPSLSASQFAGLFEGQVVQIREAVVEADGFHWRQLESPYEGSWVAGEFLEK
ncbi:MAG: SH3 domain-containing protein [Candidatus Sungbacteria bacterium]|nr:SH3 domain-containing protein [Candidatus Sungbacteria bacterium]